MRKSLKDLERIFKAIANKRRLAILKLLKDKKEATVGEISEMIVLSFRSTSKHLMILFNADILEKEQRSLQVYYRLSKNKNSLVDFIISRL